MAALHAEGKNAAIRRVSLCLEEASFVPSCLTDKSFIFIKRKTSVKSLRGTYNGFYAGNLSLKIVC